MSPINEAGPSQPHPLPAPTPRFIDEGYLELVEIIGTGAYGVVWLGIDCRYGTPVYRAVKAIRRSGLDERQKQFQRRELALHRRASQHPSIVAMDRIVLEGDNTYVVMDYGSNGDLFAMICERRRYVGDDDLIRDVFLQLVDGIDHLHRLGISHRDIKPENIVCSNDGLRVRICDFGLATADQYSSEFGCGSSFYIAPESLGDWFPSAPTYPTRPGDVWSLGIILVNLVCGRNPWRIASPSDESFNAFLDNPLFLRKILPVSMECLDLLRCIFTLHPDERITLPELRMRVLKMKTFSMSEKEVRAAHAAAKTLQVDVPEDVEDMDAEWEPVFPFDEDMDTPALQADDGSFSPPNDRSRSSSSMGGSLPPTPLLEAHDRVGAVLAVKGDELKAGVWDLLKPVSPTPELMAGRLNPFFAQAA